MSTRSLVGAETESGTKLVYVHSDGYPDGYWGKVETLRRLVAQFGLDKVVGTLLQTPSGWSSFDGNPGETLNPGYADGRFELVPGFGVRFTDVEGQGNTKYATPEDHNEYWDVEYVYVITADGKLRWAPHGDGEWADQDWLTEDL